MGISVRFGLRYGRRLCTACTFPAALPLLLRYEEKPGLRNRQAPTGVVNEMMSCAWHPAGAVAVLRPVTATQRLQLTPVP